MSGAGLVASIDRAGTLSVGRQGQLWMFAFVALWAVVEVLAGGVLRAYSPYQVVWTRYAVHLVLMLLIWGGRQPQSLLRTRRPVYQLVRSMLMVGMPASWVMGVQRGVDARTVMAVFWISPLLILALAALVLGERAPLRIWVASLIAAAAAVLPSLGPVPHPAMLLVFPAAMAFTFSLYVVMTRSLRSETSRANLFYTALGVWVVLSPLMPRVWKAPTPADWVVMGAIGALGLLTLYAVDRATARSPVSLSAPFVWLQLGVTLILAGGLGQHSPGRRVWAGALVIAVVAAYVWVREPDLTVLEKGQIHE